MNEENLKKGIKIALKKSMSLNENNSFLIVYDKNMQVLAKKFYQQSLEITKKTKMIETPVCKIPGEEPSAEVAEEMKKYDVVVCITTKSLSHTDARLNACEAGTNIVTMPGITEEIIERIFDVDYDQMFEIGEKIKNTLDDAKEVRVTTAAGTDIIMSFSGRTFKNSSGLLKEKGAFGNLPGSEVYSSPIEGSTNGVYVVDASQAGLGKLDDSLRIHVKDGFAISIEGSKSEELRKLLDSVNDKNAYNIAELGIGTNPKAIVTGNTLEDEKVAGTCHIALGRSKGFGGNVIVPIHLDGIMNKPTIEVNGTVVIKDGEVVI